MDAYQRTGRGGAGNFWSKKDIEEVTKGKSGVSLTSISPMPYYRVQSLVMFPTEARAIRPAAV